MPSNQDVPKSIIGNYGDWAAQLLHDPAELSFRNEQYSRIEQWRGLAMQQTHECLAAPEIPRYGSVDVLGHSTFEGLEIELWEWQLPYGNPTRGLFLKPVDRGDRPLPGILALHDHGGNKYLGWRKIAQKEDRRPDFIRQHHHDYYGGVAWANELAKRGYAVLVSDAFTFGSRRVLLEDIEGITWGMPDVPPAPQDGQEDSKYIDSYNQWAAAHEHVLSKSLFCAGTTWPGVFLREDQAALNILANRSEVDATRLGCCGLSGGGLRSVMLGGLDQRIKCAIAVGFMTTWKDLVLHKSFTHTWMTYVPRLPRYLDFPEILGLRVPLPTMVLNNNQDQLFTLSEMHRADQILGETFKKAKASDHYRGIFYEGEHKFDLAMQADAFDWFDQWIG